MSVFTIDKNWKDFVAALIQRYSYHLDMGNGVAPSLAADEASDCLDRIEEDVQKSIYAILDRKAVAQEWAKDDPKWHRTLEALQLEYSLMGRAARDLACRFRTWPQVQADQCSRDKHAISDFGQLNTHLIRQLTELAPKEELNG